MKHLYLIVLFYCLPFQSLAQTFIPGEVYLDSTGYVEYTAGNLPIVISVPHGGYLEPAVIPDRDCTGCSYLRDSYTQELGREIQEAFVLATGCYPHLVVNLLHRKKFDANRDIEDAADGNPTVEQSWYAYHEFLDSAKMKIVQDYQSGLFLDMHGHAHEIERVELGYALSKNELQLSDVDLNMQTYVEESSIQNLVTINLGNLMHADLLRGDFSFGTMLEEQGFPTVPSAANPFPEDDEPYFSGGYNTIRHGSINGGTIDGIQVECNSAIRFESDSRQEFADSIVQSIIHYIDTHYDVQFDESFCNVISSNTSVAFSESLNIYPNPATHSLQIESDLEEFHILIYNSLGQQVDFVKWNKLPFDISALKKGIYFLEFRSNGLRFASKVLIKK